MPITATNLTSNVVLSVSSQATASISPGANKLIIVAVASQLGGTPNSPTLTGAGMTWVAIGNSLNSDRRVTLFRGLSASPGSGALTINFAGQVQTRLNWSVDQFDGMDTSGSNGANAIVQTQTNTASGTLTGITVTLSALGSTNNAAYGVVRQAAIAPTKGAAFTLLSAQTGHNAEWALNQTAVNWTWASTNAPVCAIAIEIKAASASASQAPRTDHQARLRR